MKQVTLIGLFGGIIACNPFIGEKTIIGAIIFCALIALEHIFENKLSGRLKYVPLFKTIIFVLAFNLAAILYNKPLSNTLIMSGAFGMMIYYFTKAKMPKNTEAKIEAKI